MTVAASLPFPIRSVDNLATDAYLAFLAGRPENERWQLIDGFAFMMSPATKRHQVIAFNLQLLLYQALERTRPELIALQEVGLIVPGRGDFRPQADIAVVEADAPEGVWQERFFLAAEVLSPSNTAEFIEEKRRNYMAHPDNLYVLVIAQDTMQVEVLGRRTDWRRDILRGGEAVFDLPEFGFECRLHELYRKTGLSDR